jgi:ElaA protein
VNLRVHTFDDLDVRTAYALWRLRQQVFVVEQQSPYPDLDGRDLEPTTRHVLVSEGGELIACLRVLDDGSHARIGRVAVTPATRGRGLARDLMTAALAEIGDREIRLDAQTGLTDWYAGYGFEISGPEFVEDGVAHRPMRRPQSE